MNWIEKFDSEWLGICQQLLYKGKRVYGWRQHFKLDTVIKSISKYGAHETIYGKHKQSYVIDKVQYDELGQAHSVHFFEMELTDEDIKMFLKLEDIYDFIQLAKNEEDNEKLYEIAKKLYDEVIK